MLQGIKCSDKALQPKVFVPDGKASNEQFDRDKKVTGTFRTCQKIISVGG